MKISFKSPDLNFLISFPFFFVLFYEINCLLIVHDNPKTFQRINETIIFNHKSVKLLRLSILKNVQKNPWEAFSYHHLILSKTKPSILKIDLNFFIFCCCSKWEEYRYNFYCCKYSFILIKNPLNSTIQLPPAPALAFDHFNFTFLSNFFVLIFFCMTNFCMYQRGRHVWGLGVWLLKGVSRSMKVGGEGAGLLGVRDLNNFVNNEFLFTVCNISDFQMPSILHKPPPSPHKAPLPLPSLYIFPTDPSPSPIFMKPLTTAH